MTYKEALDVLRRGIRCNSDDCPTVDCKECEYSVTDEEWNEAFTKALEALEESEDCTCGSRACISGEKTHVKTTDDFISRQSTKSRMRKAMSDMEKWIPCNEQMPEPDKLVLMQCRGKSAVSGYRYFQVLGVWIPPLTIKAADKWTDESYDVEVYDEDTDEYYCESGWYEETTQGDGDGMSYRMSAEVTAWMPLPETYKGEKDE